MNAPFPPAEARRALIERHADLIEAAIKAVSARAAWSPFKDSPSTKIHGPDKPVAGKAAFEAQLNRPFDLDLPGHEPLTFAAAFQSVAQPDGLLPAKAGLD